MKRIMITMVIGLVTGYVQAQKLKESDVSSSAKQTFSQKFPKVKEEKWKTEDATAIEAEFEIGEAKYSARFNKSGKGLETESEIKAKELPEAKRSLWSKATIAPATIIVTGLLATTDNNLISPLEIHEERDEMIPKFRTNVDDYLQYAPLAAVYSLNALGIKGEHDFVNRTALLIKSELIMAAIVFALKKLTVVPRPDTGAPTSFPSGHTAQAFAAATFLHKEYGKEHPLYSVLAYTTATGIGVLRVMNNRHWASDVLVGAGIGILATNLAYLSHKNITIRKNKKSAVLVSPMYNQGSIGAYMMISLK